MSGVIYEVTLGERLVKVEVARADRGWRVRVDGGAEVLVAGSAVGGAEWLLDIAGRQRSIGLAVRGEHFDAQIDGHALRGQVVDSRRKAFNVAGTADHGDIRTPMPGVVVRVPVAPDEVVHKGQVLVVVEAMKMENEFKAPVAGRVVAVHVKAGQAVDSNAVLISVEPTP